MSAFTDAFSKEASKKFTENGCEAFNTTQSKMLDLFATIGALRERSEEDIIAAFEAAYAESPRYAILCLFYGRDVRGGCGERRTFRVILRHLAKVHPACVTANIGVIPYYGRFDDWYVLCDTLCEDDMWLAMRNQFMSDLNKMEKGEPVSLLAKWIKSPDASSKESKALGCRTAKAMGYSIYDFKRVLRKLRKYIGIVETKMCQNQWDTIEYGAVPSRAMSIYRNAFMKHSEEAFTEYLRKVNEGREKINASTLYPYDIVEAIRYCRGTDVAEAQWKALPNYLIDKDGNPIESNILVMADVSGSMEGRPMNSAVGLALYFAERNKGTYHNKFMTFSTNPVLLDIPEGVGLRDRIRMVMNTPWGGNTDFYKAMMKVLDLCVNNNVAQEDVPKALVCITDMEFDYATAENCVWACRDKNADRSWTAGIYERCKQAFEEKGYKLPTLVFWNVNARNDTFHTDKMNMGTLCVSGQSPSAFKTVMSCIGMTPYEAMVATLDSERYSMVTA